MSRVAQKRVPQKRAPQKRWFKGQHMDDSRFIGHVEYEGQLWCLYEGAPGPGTLVNVKLAVEGRALGKANYWLIWNGKNLISRAHGRLLKEQRPGLHWATERCLSESLGLGTTVNGSCPEVRARETAGASRAGTTVNPRRGPVVPPSKPDASALPDGADLI